MTLKTRAVLAVVVGVVMGLCLSIGGAWLAEREAPQLAQEDLAWEQARLFAEVLERVKRDYVEPIDDARLLESAIRGMVADLDAHSEYLDADEYRDIRISTTGSYTGVGIEVGEIDGKVHVITPIAGSPAARSGIRSGDRIIAVDGYSVDRDHLQETIHRMRGLPGSQVTVTVLRDDDAIDHVMRRELVRVSSVHAQLMQPAYGYVRLNQFSDTTARELSRAVDALADENSGMLAGLVLDLRNNPGGVLDSAVDVADLFLDAGLIVSADGRSAESRFERLAHPGDILDGADIVILVNGGLGIGVGDRGGCPAGSCPRADRRDRDLRQGAGPDCHAPVQGTGDQAHHFALLHAVRRLDSRDGHHPGCLHRRYTGIPGS